MAPKIQIRMGGYGPASTCFSKALKFIGDRLEAEFGDAIDVKYVWNIMDFGYRSEDILWLVESGILRPTGCPNSASLICRFCSPTRTRRALLSTARWALSS
jgi:hypothetical protein